MSFVVRYSVSTRDDLKRIYEHMLDRATTVEYLVSSSQTTATELPRQASDRRLWR